MRSSEITLKTLKILKFNSIHIYVIKSASNELYTYKWCKLQYIINVLSIHSLQYILTCLRVNSDQCMSACECIVHLG